MTFSTILLQRCPRCGKGKLFRGLLSINETCSSCQLSLAAHDSADGPAFISIILIGFLSTGLAAWIELTWEPDLWLHAAIQVPFILLGSLLSLRLSKSWLIAMQYKYKTPGFDHVD